MSVHRKKGERPESDFFATPPEVVEVGVQFAERLMRRPPRTILEPGSAANAPYLSAARQRWPEASLLGIEYLSREAAEAGVHENAHSAVIFDTDFMAWGAATERRFDLIITNPPFSLALPFVQAGLRLLAPAGLLVYLLRLSWFATKKRYLAVNRDNPPVAALILVERPSFSGDGGTDSEEYAYFAYQANNPVRSTGVTWRSWR